MKPLMKRPWKDRVWFYPPQIFMDWRLFWLGDDEYHYRTLVIGFPFTGQIVIAFKEMTCTEDDDCLFDPDYPGWPIDYYTWESARRYESVMNKRK